MIITVVQQVSPKVVISESYKSLAITQYVQSSFTAF